MAAAEFALYNYLRNKFYVGWYASKKLKEQIYNVDFRGK